MILLIAILAGIGCAVLFVALVWWMILPSEDIYDRMP